MSWMVLAFIAAAALLAPFFGADSRDGRDWKPSTPPAPDERRSYPPQPPLRRLDSRERPSEVRVPVACARQVRAGG